MNAIDYFLSLEPLDRVKLIMENKFNFPNDPYPALRCLASNPKENFPSLDDSVISELRSYTRLLAELGYIDPNDVESWAKSADKYVIALAVMRVKVN
jgi:hypothetical protein